MNIGKTSFGHFDDLTKEFVVTRPDTPYPWINYLGNEDFFGLVSNTAGGYAFYKDAKFRRITRYRYNNVPMDQGGRYFYIKDGATIWNPGWQPSRTPLDRYECRHGLGYTVIKGEKDGMEAELLLFVPLGQPVEIHKLTLRNLGAEKKQIQLYSLIEWCLWNASTDMENFQRNFSTGEVEVDGSTIYHKTEYKERRNHYAFYTVNQPIDGFDTDRESFIGLYNGFDEPECVTEGISKNSVAMGWSPVASQRIDLSLEPGEEKSFIFLLGYVENLPEEKFDNEDTRRKKDGTLLSSQASDVTFVNKAKAHHLTELFNSNEKVDKALAELKSYWEKLLGKYHIESPDPRLDRMVNIWNQYQCMVTFNFSRSASFFESGVGRGMGFRDSNQDLVGFVHQIPERARQRIIDIASTQFPDGGCYHQYQPLTKRGNNDIGTGFNDDPLWLIFGTIAYIKETGDFTILDHPVPWDNKPGTEVPLMDHLRASIKHVLENLGPHGLPLIGRADWNDCLNLNCFSDNPDESYQTTENKTEGSKAESLMIAGLFVCEVREYASLCHYLGMEEERQDMERLADEMEQAVINHGWDGDWYLRAYDFYGNKIGSEENDEGKIFIESQGWCGMARIGAEEGMVAKSLDSCKKYLDSPDGMALNWPAFTRWHKEMGEISSYPAGYKENAGIFCHNNPWVIIAEVLEGRTEDAWKHYTQIAPAWIEDQQRHKVEPYVYSQMIAGPDAVTPGQGKNSWLTGTAAWNWLTVSQYILGIRPDFDSLVITPSLPKEIDSLKIRREWRDAIYDIEIENKGSQSVKVTVDGKELEGNRIPYTPGTHNVKVIS